MTNTNLRTQLAGKGPATTSMQQRGGKQIELGGTSLSLTRV
eukprot:CAMPEP_0118797812 /NCGR_PEP_ID=MMETSP1161-20130426/285_1 /TAXON_ID=249345 /ORGANISM="Picochlorum oklahomensis, Strain CCMP2329" /LENGTH=40 /DNA_ID= /DNA_START= /DNA_END= /DNA_ORIENTATION=